MADTNQHVVVIGGGIAGMETAASLADLGLKVALVERSETLGGQAAHWACMATTSCAKCSACLIEDSISRTSLHPGIQVYTHAEITEIRKENGHYEMDLVPARGSMKERNTHPDWPVKTPTTVQGNSVVLATGFEPFDPKNQRLLGYGHLPEVTTTKDLDDILKRDDLDAFLPKSENANRVAFIQCVGSRDRKNGREYCSQFCCKTSIRLVNRMKHLRPELDVTIYYIDLQIMGKEFRSFYEDTKKNVRFLQGVPAEVRPGSEVGSVKLVGIDPKTGLGMVEEYNRVVLAVGMAPDIRNQKLIDGFGLETNEFGFFASKDDSGLITTQTPGVYLAGACAGPSDIQQSRLQAMAAARRIAAGLVNGGATASQTA